MSNFRVDVVEFPISVQEAVALARAEEARRAGRPAPAPSARADAAVGAECNARREAARQRFLHWSRDAWKTEGIAPGPQGSGR